jgi:hypothetical protein
MDAWTHTTATARLGVSVDVSARELKKAFRELAKKTHPDIAGPRGHDLFLEIRSAYDFLMGSGRLPDAPPPRPAPSAAPPPSSKPIDVGDWLLVQYLVIDGIVHHGNHRAQVTVVDYELCIGIYLDPSFEGPVGSLLVALSQEADTEVSIYERPAISTSSLGKTTTVIWFSPFERRMRVDGRPLDDPVDEEMVWKRFFDARRRKS